MNIVYVSKKKSLESCAQIILLNIKQVINN